MAEDWEIRDRLENSVKADDNDLIVKCAHCNGSGKGWASDQCCADYSGFRGTAGVNDRVRCCTCGGTGLVRV